jgi:hypothetical protein
MIIKFIILLLILNTNVFSKNIRIFINQLKTNDANAEAEFRRELKSELIKTEEYTVIDEDAYSNLLENLKKHQLLGCDETKCIQEIANAVETDETLTGELSGYGNSYLLQLKSTLRDDKTFTLSSKFILQNRFTLSNRSSFIKELIKYIKDPSYRIQNFDKSKNNYFTNKEIYLQMPPPLKLESNSKEISIDDISDKGKLVEYYLKNGDTYLKKGKYLLAFKEYKLLEDKLSDPLFEENRFLKSSAIPYRKDLVFLGSFEEEATQLFAILNSQSKWEISDIEEEIYPKLVSLENYNKNILESSEGKKAFSEREIILLDWKCTIQKNLLKLYYINDKIEKYYNMFFDFESSIKKLQSLSPELYKKYTAQYASEEKIKNNLSEKFFPYWNEELKKSCKTIQLAVKFYNNFYYEEIQKEAFNKFKTIYITNNTKIGEGYKAIKTDTYKECYGILPEKIKKSYEDYSGIFK